MRQALAALAALILFFPTNSIWASEHSEHNQKVETPTEATAIERFYTVNEEVLHIIFSDGRNVQINKERGRYSINEDVLTQIGFEKIQLAEDNHHIGWLASYMICAQSYPCTPELVIYHAERGIKYILPPHGVMWNWKFIDGGKQISVQYGFPHGDEGPFALYETDSGNKLADYSAIEKTTPGWVQQLLPTRK
jgi:hypothetical protein